MRRLQKIALPATLVLLGGLAVSRAQDTPPPPPPTPTNPSPEGAPEAVVETKSDPAALALLEAAAVRQGGLELARPGALQSFRIVFGRILVWRHTRKEDGGWTSANDEASAMSIDWLRHEGGPSSLRTFWEINGQKVWRAVYSPRNAFWLSDGKEITQLTEGTHDADREEVLLHRRLSETLLDVAVLHKLRTDGSVWRMADDEAYSGIALRRTPASGKTGLTFTIWLDPETKDPHHVRVEPVEDGAPVMHYELIYKPGLPAVNGAELRFPQEIWVRESYADVPLREVMRLFVASIDFNSVTSADFAPKNTLGK